MGDERDHWSDETCTVMLTDIEDSTWLWEHHPSDMEIAIPGHHDALGVAVNQLNGDVIKSTGDGILAVFADAADAVDAAVDIQRQVAVQEWPGIGVLRVRIGLNSGTCRRTSGDILGRPPNLAARLQSAGHGGQILLSGTTATACSGRLRRGEQLVDLGLYLIRGFDEPIVVHTVIAEGLRSGFPPLRAAASAVDELPPDESELIGRGTTISEAARRLEHQRLVTLWGPGGVGKTRLAVRVAASVRPRFSDGVRFIDLAALADPTAVPDTLVAALRAQPMGGERPIDTLVRTIGAGSVLMVLDNCEQVLDGVRLSVDAILRRCAGTCILTTSREPLGRSGESTLEIRPLAVPHDGATSPAQVGSVDSVQLFMARVTASVPEFALTAANAAVIAGLCRATDGLPLAVELAAARAVVEGLPEPSVSLRRMTPIELRDQDGLETSLMRTLSALEPSEAELFSWLAAFHGPFTRQLALALAPRRDLASRDLDRLVRTAMVQKDGDAGQYRMLTPARRFGWDRLDTSDRERAGWSHAQLMLAEAEAANALMQTDREATAVAAIRSQFADHRAALQWFLDHDALHEAASLVNALFLFCLFQPQPEGHSWASTVSDRLRGDEPLASEIAGAAAIGCWYAGDTHGAIDLANRAVSIAADTGGSALWARQALIYALGYVGDLEAVTPHYLALVNGIRESDQPFWRVYGLGIEAISLTMFGMPEDASRRVSESLTLAHRVGNPECVNWAFYTLGRVLAAQDPLGACEAFEQAMRAAREVGSRFSVSLSLVEWVALKRRLGELPMALAGTLDLLELLAVSGNRSQLSQALHEAGLLLADAGRPEQAALALLARRGMPAMPTDIASGVRDTDDLSGLELLLPDQWPRLRVRAHAFTEPELIALCRDELGRLQTEQMSLQSS